MQDTVIYSPPNEGRIWNAPLERMLRDVQERDEHYWRAGAGCGSIFIGTDLAKAPSLTLVLTGVKGFYVELSNGGKTQIAKAANDSDEVVTLPVGQSIFRYPVTYLVGREECTEIVRCFYNSHSASPESVWVDKNAIGWSFVVDHSDDDE